MKPSVRTAIGNPRRPRFHWICNIFSWRFSRFERGCHTINNRPHHIAASLLVPTMMRAGAVLFLSAMSFLTAHCFLPAPQLPRTPAVLSTTRVKAAGIAGTAPRLAMDTADVCRGDAPTPGWVRLAQRNLARVRVGDVLPDACVRYIRS